MLLTALAAGLIAASQGSAWQVQPEYGHSLKDSYDFVIVGGGTAALAVANRLTESGNNTVLVIERAGHPDTVRNYKQPGACLGVLGSAIDYATDLVPQKTLDNRVLTYHRGKALGGTSTINGLIYLRGSKACYDSWERLGNDGWNWESFQPYFKKSVTMNPPNVDYPYAGYDPSIYGDGPIQLTFPPYQVDSSEHFVMACGVLGIEPTNETSNGNNTGARKAPYTIDTSYQRSSAVEAYLNPAIDRPNLDVLTWSVVNQIILEEQGGQQVATGVVIDNAPSGKTVNITANNEVLVAAGAHFSPQILMLSGIGPADELAANGVETKVANENVGKDLQDHAWVSVMARVQANASLTDYYSNVALLQEAGAEWDDSQSGPFTTTPSTGGTTAFLRLSIDELKSLGATDDFLSLYNQTTHFEFSYEPTFYPNVPTSKYVPLRNESYITLSANWLIPQSRGQVTLQSNTISDHPWIDLNHYDAEIDKQAAILGLKSLRKILQSPHLQQFVVGDNYGEVSPGPSVQSDDDILAYVQGSASLAGHSCNTCSMRPRDQGGVVDNRLRVYDVKGLRVVDQSVFPQVIDAHQVSTVYAVAERAAAMILEDWGQ